MKSKEHYIDKLKDKTYIETCEHLVMLRRRNKIDNDMLKELSLYNLNKLISSF